tara:strand:+ start:2296 stop:2523 length:228 start_codon:yes stop_codon:yes gene_type:complete
VGGIGCNPILPEATGGCTGLLCDEWTYLIQVLFELIALLWIDLVSCNLLLAALGPNFIRAHPGMFLQVIDLKYLM